MWWWRFSLIGLFLAAVCNANAQTGTVQDDEPLFNWYYAAIFGTGVYSAGDRTVAVLQAPLSFSLRERSEDQWGLRLKLPVSLGFYDFDFGAWSQPGERRVSFGRPARSPLDHALDVLADRSIAAVVFSVACVF